MRLIFSVRACWPVGRSIWSPPATWRTPANNRGWAGRMTPGRISSPRGLCKTRCSRAGLCLARTPLPYLHTSHQATRPKLKNGITGVSKPTWKCHFWKDVVIICPCFIDSLFFWNVKNVIYWYDTHTILHSL